MIRHQVFRFPRTKSWEDACEEVETWINAHISSESVVSVMMEDNEQGASSDVIVVWYRASK